MAGDEGVLMRHARVLIAVSAVWLVACRDKWDVRNYAENLAEARCAKAYDCCTEREIEASEQEMYGVDEGDCVDATADALGFKEDLIKEGIDAGRLSYDGALLERCVKGYAALSCEELKNEATASIAECEAFLVAKVADGGKCKLGEECVTRNCQRVDAEDAEGTCQPFAAQGASCGTATCGPGTYCAGTCVPTRPDGAACGSNFECATGGCNGYDGASGTAGTCGPMGGEGTQCYLTKGCAAAPPHVVAALAVILWLWRSRARRSRERVVSTH